MHERTWRKLNIGLLTTIIVVNLYTILLPWIPSLFYQASTKRSPEARMTAVAYAEKAPDAPGNRLIIPKILLNTELHEGAMRDSFNLLNKGAWRLPIGSDPTKPSNTVIAGHRFSYTGPRGIFYELDELKPGDEIGLKWDDKLYTYKVESSTVHPPTDVYVQEPTDDTRLTLYTCTPLWNPVNRLVVVAKPVETAP